MGGSPCLAVSGLDKDRETKWSEHGPWTQLYLNLYLGVGTSLPCDPQHTAYLF